MSRPYDLDQAQFTALSAAMDLVYEALEKPSGKPPTDRESLIVAAMSAGHIEVCLDLYQSEHADPSYFWQSNLNKNAWCSQFFCTEDEAWLDAARFFKLGGK